MIQLIYLLSQIQFQSSDPITPDGGIGAGVALVAAFTIIGALGLFIANNAINTFKEEIRRIHLRIDAREKEHDNLDIKHGELATRVLLVESKQKIHTESQSEQIAKLILDKLGALQGNAKGQVNKPYFNE